MKKYFIRLTALMLSLLLLLPYAAAAEESEAQQLNALFTTADLMDATIADMLEAMDEGRLTSERLTQMYLDRIEKYDIPMELRTIINLNPNAIAEARRADQMRANGATGRLLGIPILVKDSIDVAGLPTTCGAYLRQNSIAAADAEAVARLRAEGAVFLGKTNMSTFSETAGNSISEIAGMVGNAYDPSRTPAGSSGGSAVAVACCFCAAALGADTYSSLRRPASFAGIYTLRSSFGMVSQIGMERLNFDQDVIGPMCRNAEDMALVFDVIAGTDPADPYTEAADLYIPRGGYTSVLDENGLQGKRIGYLANSFGYLYQVGTDQLAQLPQPLDPKITGMVDRTKQILIDGGAELVDLSTELSEYYVASVTGNGTPSNMLSIREHVTQVLEKNHIDAVIYVSQNDVPETQEDPTGKFDNPSRYLFTFSPLGGLPEIVLPMGLSKTDPADGVTHALPLGLSMFAGYGKDDVLLQIAYAYDQIADVKTHPWTTPVLPDYNLAAYAKDLLSQAETLERSVYKQEQLAAVDSAAEALAPMKMGSGDGVAAYQTAVRALEDALGALEPVLPPETEATEETEPTEQTEQPEETKPTRATASTEPISAKDLLPRSTRFPWELPVIVTVLLWALIFWYKRKFGDDDEP
ncbi:MAG: amidase [Oscillospiraceae bacterium]|nr:amidase [Oscillospiraceae bacterium]